MTPSKRKWQVLFVILLSAAGFFVGGAVGKLSIPAGSGLAGPAILLGYLAAGAGIALVIGIVLGMKLKGEHLRQAAFAALILLILAMAALFLIPKKRINAAQPAAALRFQAGEVGSVLAGSCLMFAGSARKW